MTETLDSMGSWGTWLLVGLFYLFWWACCKVDSFFKGVAQMRQDINRMQQQLEVLENE